MAVVGRFRKLVEPTLGALGLEWLEVRQALRRPAALRGALSHPLAFVRRLAREKASGGAQASTQLAKAAERKAQAVTVKARCLAQASASSYARVAAAAAIKAATTAYERTFELCVKRRREEAERQIAKRARLDESLLNSPPFYCRYGPLSLELSFKEVKQSVDAPAMLQVGPSLRPEHATAVKSAMAVRTAAVRTVREVRAQVQVQSAMAARERTAAMELNTVEARQAPELAQVHELAQARAEAHAKAELPGGTDPASLMASTVSDAGGRRVASGGLRIRSVHVAGLRPLADLPVARCDWRAIGMPSNAPYIERVEGQPRLTFPLPLPALMLRKLEDWLGRRGADGSASTSGGASAGASADTNGSTSASTDCPPPALVAGLVVYSRATHNQTPGLSVRTIGHVALRSDVERAGNKSQKTARRRRRGGSLCSAIASSLPSSSSSLSPLSSSDQPDSHSQEEVEAFNGAGDDTPLVFTPSPCLEGCLCPGNGPCVATAGRPCTDV